MKFYLKRPLFYCWLGSSFHMVTCQLYLSISFECYLRSKMDISFRIMFLATL